MNCSPSTTSDLHRRMLDLLLHRTHDMQYVFDTIPRYGDTPSTDLVVYQHEGDNHDHHEFQQFMSIITFAALLEYIQDPDPPEIRALEQQQKIDQLELENDSLFVAMEDAQWELERVQRDYLIMKQRFYYVSNDYSSYQRTQDLLLLTLGQQYSDLQFEYASLKSDLDDYQIMNQEQLVNRDEMVQGLMQERKRLQTRNEDTTKKLTKLQHQLDTYQVALASKDLKLFQLVEERDSLKQQVKRKEYQAKLDVLLSNKNHSTHSQESATTTSTTTTTPSTSTGDDGSEEESSTEHAPIKSTTSTASPNRWVQGLNRMRPAARTRRSPKVQPLTPKEMEK
jgi:hypothetical protein